MRELLSVDYYLQHKIKPASRYTEEINKKEKFALLENKQLPHHKYRYTVIPLSFHFETFTKENKITNKEELFFVEYDGVNPPTIKTSDRFQSNKKALRLEGFFENQ